jgi:hypothetical protein
MKKYILPILAFSTLFSCKKEHTNAPPLESSQQLLTKVVKTADYGGGTFTIDYAYNNAGKLIKEGYKTYERDDQQRIVRMLNFSSANPDIQVHYSSKNPNQVDYTFCRMTASNATDSVAYLHDANGRLIKTMRYHTYFSDRDVPAIPFLGEYKILSYDANGNLIQANVYERDYEGKETPAGDYFFLNYDKGINPLCTGDEVRLTDFSCGSLFHFMYGILNSSTNNFTTTNYGYSKFFEYRTDGKPKSCLVQQNGKNVFKLIYEYK